jgi:hypothetical protein
MGAGKQRQRFAVTARIKMPPAGHKSLIGVLSQMKYGAGTPEYGKGRCNNGKECYSLHVTRNKRALKNIVLQYHVFQQIYSMILIACQTCQPAVLKIQ